MLASLFGFFFGMIAVLAAAVVLVSGLPNISTLGNGRHNPRPAIARTVTVELQRHPVAKKAEKGVAPVVAEADTKEIKHYKPKVLARQRNNSGYGHALGYAEESRYGPSNLFFRGSGSREVKELSPSSPHWVKVKNLNCAGGEARGRGRLAVMTNRDRTQLQVAPGASSSLEAAGLTARP